MVVNPLGNRYGRCRDPRLAWSSIAPKQLIGLSFFLFSIQILDDGFNNEVVDRSFFSPSLIKRKNSGERPGHCAEVPGSDAVLNVKSPPDRVSQIVQRLSGS